MSYTRIRTCTICDKKETIRKDNKSIICKSCSSKKSGEKGLKTIRDNTVWKNCKGCNNKIQTYKKWNYCSKECSHKSKITTRICKECNKEFEVLKSTLKTNASGNYCSRKCYENYMCDTDRTNGRGSQWKKIRNIAIKKAPFCAICGTARKLQVHHIIPYRYTNDNTQENLIPLCVKHHKTIEILTNDILKIHKDFTVSQFILKNIFRDYQLATAIKLKELNC